MPILQSALSLKAIFKMPKLQHMGRRPLYR